MTREEIEEVMGASKPIQASFEVIGDDVKFIKLIVNGKENIVSVEELENTPSEPCRETDDYENEIADLHNRLDIAEYDKERLREEVTILEEKLKALSTEPCEDCITLRLEKGTLKYSNKDYVVYKKEWLKKWWQPELALLGIDLPSIQPKPKTGHWIYKHIVDDCNGVITWYECSECGRSIDETITEEFMLKDYPYCHCGAMMLPTDSKKE